MASRLTSRTKSLEQAGFGLFYRLKDKQRDLEKSLDSYVVTHVSQTWKPLMEGLERISEAVEELGNIEI